MDVMTAFPVSLATYRAPPRSGLVVVDEVDGFCTPGCGPLAPVSPDARIEAMVAETDKVARLFLEAGRPVLSLQDSHAADRPEAPYPPHCIEGSGHDELVGRLAWMPGHPGLTILRKDCIDGSVAGVRARSGGNAFFDWIVGNDLSAVVFVGICTDICVLDVVASTLSARNHHVTAPGGRTVPLLGDLRDVVVHEPGCATYDLPARVAASLGLPPTAAHPAAECHRAGLYVMQSRGAVLCDRLDTGSWDG